MEYYITRTADTPVANLDYSKLKTKTKAVVQKKGARIDLPER